MEERRQRLIAECKRIQENCLYNATSHFTAAGVTGWAQTVIGAVPIVLGGIGSWKFLSDPTLASPKQVYIASVLSLLAGIAGSLLSFWDLAKSRLSHFSAGSKYKSLENDARRAWQVYGPAEEVDFLQKRVEDVAKRYDQLGEASELSGDIMFLIARWKIGKRIFANEVDQARG